MLKSRLVAHRGYQRLYPENTLLAIDKAIAAGAQHIELDVMFSADGVPVMYHDQNMRRISDIDMDIDQLAASELLQTPAFEPMRLGNRYSSECIAPLSALSSHLESRPDLTFFVEAKRNGIRFMGIDKALNALEDALAPIQQHTVLISFDKDFIAAARARSWPAVGIVLESWNDLQHPIMDTVKPDYLFVSQRHIPERASLDLDDALLVVYEIGDPELAIQWFRRGADMVETFDIGGLLTELAHRAL